jgi:branched-chain amino acid transport system permease protein
MQDLAQQIVSGLATGSVIASMALALVLIYRSMGVVNFAQGEMAMLSTYLAWQLAHQGLPLWAAFAVTIAVSFAGAVALEWIVIRPIERAEHLTVVVVTLGLFITLNGIAGWIWGYVVKPFPTPFPLTPLRVGNVFFSSQDIGIIVVSLAALGAITLLFQRTKLGLAMRAAAIYPDECRSLGIRVSWMLALGWGLAAAMGAISGIMVAPIAFLDPNMMQGILVYAFAAAVLGGIESPLGAVIGGLVLGVLVNLVGTYIPFIGTELRLAFAFVVIVGVLLVRPAGLFGRQELQRV